MLQVQRFVNQLMTSNCYLLYNDETNHAVVIDPGSEKMEDVVSFIDDHHLALDYILLTHEHTDHTWGVNALIDKYNASVVCSSACKEALPKECQAYFSFYYDDPDYDYQIAKIDLVTEELDNKLIWDDNTITFLNIPGHSQGSICISIANYLFTGDAMMQYKPFIDKRSGSKEKYQQSIVLIKQLFPDDTTVLPGHGDAFALTDFK
jgi:glyoxylase-like metal-dependent hydrolase (beta-lactamase superfamily II)